MTERDREVRLSWKEVQKLEVLKEVQAGTRTQVSAAAALGMTDRWIRTLLRRLSQRGSAALVHGSRGKPSRRRVADSLRQRIVELYRGKYDGFNLTHFREMLEEHERLHPPAREWLRKVLGESGAWQPRRRARHHRQRRPRRDRAGELLQFDASTHAWLGEGQPRIALVGSIDDATGEVVAKFFPAETSEAYLTLIRMILAKRGVPQAVYSDRHSVFVVNNAKEADLQRARGRILETQVGRALKELGIEWIAAYSPQAKGRIERVWGIFQDRLLHELQLMGIRTMEKANEYLRRRFLPRYNLKFRVNAVRKGSAYRPAPLVRVIQGILCWKERRVLGRDHTFSCDGKFWQVLPCASIPALAGRSIEIRRTLRGTLEAWVGEIRLTIRAASPFVRPQDLRAAEPSYRTRGKVHRPTLSTRLNKT